MGSQIIARSRGVERARTAFGRLIFFLMRRRLKKVPVPARIMALRPPLLRGGAFMELAQESASVVPLRLKKLAQTLTATRIGCPFWMDINAAGSSDAGATLDQLRSVARYETSPHFTEDERIVLRFADLLTATPADVPDDVYAAVVNLLGEEGTVELTSAIAWENYRARFNRAFDVEAEGFCALPL